MNRIKTLKIASFLAPALLSASIFLPQASYALSQGFGQTGQYSGTASFPSSKKYRDAVTGAQGQSWSIPDGGLSLNSGLNIGDPCSGDLGSFVSAIQSDFAKRYVNSFKRSLNIAVDPTGMLIGLTARYLTPVLEGLTQSLNLGFNDLFNARLASCQSLYHGKDKDWHNIKKSGFFSKLAHETVTTSGVLTKCDVPLLKEGSYLNYSGLFSRKEKVAGETTGKNPSKDSLQDLLRCANASNKQGQPETKYNIFAFTNAVDPMAPENEPIVEAKAAFVTRLAALGMQPIIIAQKNKYFPGSNSPIERTIADDDRSKGLIADSGDVALLSELNYPMAYVNNKAGVTSRALFASYEIARQFFSPSWRDFSSFISYMACSEGTSPSEINLCHVNSGYNIPDHMEDLLNAPKSISTSGSFGGFAKDLISYATNDGKDTPSEDVDYAIRRALFWTYTRDVLGILKNSKLVPVKPSSTVTTTQDGTMYQHSLIAADATGSSESSSPAQEYDYNGNITTSRNSVDFNAGDLADFSYKELLRRLIIDFNQTKPTPTNLGPEELTRYMQNVIPSRRANFITFVAATLSDRFVSGKLPGTNRDVTLNTMKTAMSGVNDRLAGIRAACFYPRKLTTTAFTTLRDKLDVSSANYDGKQIFNDYIDRDVAETTGTLKSSLTQNSIFEFQTSPPLFYFPQGVNGPVLSPFIKNQNNADFTIKINGQPYSNYMVLAPSSIHCNLLQVESTLGNSNYSKGLIASIRTAKADPENAEKALSASDQGFQDFRSYLLFDYMSGYATGSAAISTAVRDLKLSFPSTDVVSLGTVDKIKVIDKSSTLGKDVNFQESDPATKEQIPVEYYLNGELIPVGGTGKANVAHITAALNKLKGCKTNYVRAAANLRDYAAISFKNVALHLSSDYPLCKPIPSQSVPDSPTPPENAKLSAKKTK